MLNVITLVGRLTREPDLRRNPTTGNSIGAFTIAVDDGRKGPNGERQTLFIDCSVFGPQADTLVKYFHKGNLIATYGRLVTRQYTNKQGQLVTAFQVNCDRIEFVESAAKMNGTAEVPDTAPVPGFSQVTPASEKPASSSSAPTSMDDFTTDDVPF